MSLDLFPEADVRRVLQGHTGGVMLVFADENGERPALPYATFKAVRSGYSKLPHEETPDAEGYATYRGVVPMNVEIVAHGRGANALVARMAQRLSLPGVREELAAFQCVPGDFISLVNTTPKMDNSVFEPRWTFEFVLNWTEQVREFVGIIENVVIDCPCCGQEDEL